MQPYITQLQQDPAKTLYVKQGITYLGLFGSTARGENTPSSDIDLLVDFNKTKTLFDLSDVQSSLEAILGKKVDLVLKNRVKKHLLPYIQKDLTTVYEKN
ncbi:MAG: nucleotidyltransferase family protein [Microgenomates group bacterium]